MRRIGIISVYGLGTVAGLILLTWGGLFHTPPGRQIVEEIIERELSKALDSHADIGEISGALPGQVIANDIILSDETGAPWLTAQQLSLRWKPFSLLRQRIVIQDALLKNTVLLADPPEGDDEDEALRIKILDNLPYIEVEQLTIAALHVEVDGASHRLTAKGAIYLDGSDIALTFKAQSQDSADKAEIAFAKSPKTGGFSLDASLYADTRGIIAALLDLQAPIDLHAHGDGPVNKAALTIEGNLGHYGNLSTEIKSNFDNFDGADINARFNPGLRIHHIEELSGPLSLTARYDVNHAGGALTVKNLSTAVATIEGLVSWRAPRGFVEWMNADLSTTLAETYQPDIQNIAGPNLTVKALLDWRRNDYALDAKIMSPLATLTLQNARTDLRKVLSGSLHLESAPRNEGDFWLRNGLTFSSKLSADFADMAHFSATRITTTDGSRYTGAGSYRFSDEALGINGDLSLTPDFLKLLMPGMTPAGPVMGDVEISGPLELFTLKTAFETPAMRANGSAFPPMDITIALSGLPRLPTGEISAQANNGAPRQLNMQFRSSEDGTIRIPYLAYGGRDFGLDGSAQIDPARQTANLNLVYVGDGDAEPWPGIRATGDGVIKGVFSRDGALNRMTASATALSVNDLAVSEFALNAEGPPGAVSVKATAGRLDKNGETILTSLTASGIINVSGPATLQLNRLETLVSDNAARLTEPARLAFSDGVAIDGLHLAWGANGAIAFDGAFSDLHWQAIAKFSNVTIPGADGQITGSLSLDTNKKTPARGEFSLRSLLTNQEDANISGRAIWDGKTVHLVDQQDNNKLKMDVHLPAQLTRTPKLGIDTSNELSGHIRYNGNMQTIAAYLPPVLQTIEGAFAANFELAGSLAEPSLSGRAQLTDGAYTEIESGFSLTGVHAEAEANYGADASIVAFKGGARGADQSGGDSITFNGGIAFGDSANLNLAIKLDKAELSAHPVNQLRADGNVSIAGPLDALRAAGDITITELDAEIVTPETTGLVDIEVVSLQDETVTPETLTAAHNNYLDFDIHIEADDRIFIRGRGLESEWSADVNAVNGREEPLVLGLLTLRRGWLDFSGRRFDLSRGSIEFDHLYANNPRLDIRAELDAVDGVTAEITVTGRADEPSIQLTSTPTRPSEEIMALILFGKPAQDLSPFETLQIGEALASLSGVGPFGGDGITGRLRRTVGLDLLNVDIDPQSGGGSLTVGKYVADGFFVSASQDAQGRNGSVSVKYEITDNVTVETELEQDGDQTVSANWKKDF